MEDKHIVRDEKISFPTMESSLFHVDSTKQPWFKENCKRQKKMVLLVTRER